MIEVRGSAQAKRPHVRSVGSGRNRRTFTTLCLAVCLVVSLGGIALAAARDHQLVWKDCDDGLQCAELAVPVDWADPGGPKTSVHVAKSPATGRSLGAADRQLGRPRPQHGDVQAGH